MAAAKAAYVQAVLHNRLCLGQAFGLRPSALGFGIWDFAEKLASASAVADTGRQVVVDAPIVVESMKPVSGGNEAAFDFGLLQGATRRIAEFFGVVRAAGAIDEQTALRPGDHHTDDADRLVAACEQPGGIDGAKQPMGGHGTLIYRHEARPP